MLSAPLPITNQSPDSFLRRLHPLAGSRREVQDQIQKISSESYKTTKSVLILEANGSWLDFPTRACLPKINDLAKTHIIDYYPIGNQEEFKNRIDSLKNRTYDIVWIRGHSNPQGVRLGKFFFNRGEMEAMKTIATLIRPNGKVILEGCNMGEGKENIARDFSSIATQATVYASDSLHPWESFGLNLKADGSAQFRNIIGMNATRIYRGGTLSQSE